MDELEKAAAMLTEAANKILRITKAAEVKSTYDDKLEPEFYVHIVDKEIFDQLARGRQVETKDTSYIYEQYEQSFKLHNIRFLTLKGEV